MRYIAHRGNTNGPDSQENKPEYLQKALDKGFDIEVDVWYRDGIWWTGHTFPIWKVKSLFLEDSRVWVHAKDFNTFKELQNRKGFINYFYHTTEDFVITSHKYIWQHEFQGQEGDNVIFVRPKAKEFVYENCAGICSDYVDLIKNPTVVNSCPFELLIVDVDGVLAASKTYDIHHNVISKSFVDRDFTAIKRFKANGVKVVCLSSDHWNRGMAMRRNIKWYLSESEKGVIDKSKYLDKIMADSGVRFNDKVAYIGDDFYDISLLEQVGTSFCPCNSPKSVKEVVTHVLTSKPGKGCIAEIYDTYSFSEAYPYDNL